MTILVVDDNDANLYQLQVLLSAHGYRVVTAFNGAEALDKARQDSPDLVVSDILMPVMDGFALCRIWKQDERLRQIPLVFYTATYTDERDREFALSLGAARFIVKPEEPEIFLREIREAIEEIRQPAVAPSPPAGPAPVRLQVEAPSEEESHYLKQYNQALIRKLEAKLEELERTRRDLERDIAQRKKAETALRRREADLRLAQQIGHVGSWEVDLASSALTWSEETCRIFGFDPATFVPTHEGFFKLIHSEDLVRVQMAVAEALRTGGEYEVEHRICRPDGVIRVVVEHARILRDGQGKSDRLAGTVQDITEIKQAEARIRHLNQLLLGIRNIHKLIVRETDLRHLQVEACDILVQTRGYLMVWIGHPEESTRQVVPVAWAGRGADSLKAVVVTCDDSPTGQGAVGTALRTGRAQVCEDMTSDPRFEPWRDTIVKWGYGSMACLPLSHGDRTFGAMSVYADHRGAFDAEELGLLEELAHDLAYALQNIEDDIARRRAEGQIRAQAELLDLAQDAIVVFDVNDRILYWNQGAAHIYGWTAVEAVNRKVTELFWRDGVSFQNAKDRILASGQWAAEVTQHTKDQREIAISSRCTLVRNPQGQEESFLAINTDITEKKKIEAQFLRAQRLEAIGALASGLAHDLNNVLAPVMMSAPLLRDAVKEPDARALIDTVESCAHRGADIIKQLLTFARGTPGVRVPIPIRHLLRDMAKIIRETFPRDIHPAVETSGVIWPFLGDATQFHQVLMNLCVNARDAMPNGGTLTVGARNVNVDEAYASMILDGRPGQFVCVFVSDTGTGIEPENLDRIFDPFFTTKEVGKGTGLGLATVLSIVRGHDGFVRVDSQLGQGATFELYFPASPKAEVVEVARHEALPARGRGELILVVDDEESIRESVRRVLERHGYRVVTAVQGADGLEIFNRYRAEIRAVVTDMMMPVMNGPALITALRYLDPGLVIVGMTGLSEQKDLKGLASVELAKLLLKPFPGDDLLRVLGEVFKKGAKASLPPRAE